MNGIMFLALATALCCVAAGWTTLRRRAADRAKSKEMRSRIRERYTPFKLDWSKVMDYTRIAPGKNPEA